MDKQKAKLIRNAAETALAAVAEQFGVVITYKGGSFDPGQLTAKFEFAEVASDGVAQTREATDFKRYAKSFGLEPDLLGTSFSYSGDHYTIVGMKPRAPKFPVIAERTDGKRFKFPADVVSRAQA